MNRLRTLQLASIGQSSLGKKSIGRRIRMGVRFHEFAKPHRNIFYIVEATVLPDPNSNRLKTIRWPGQWSSEHLARIVAMDLVESRIVYEARVCKVTVLGKAEKER